MANLIHYSNGLTLSKDGKNLLVAEMLAGRILRFPIQADGTLGPRTVWARLQDLAPPTAREDAYNGPDGLKLGPRRQLLHRAERLGPRAGGERDRKLVRIITVPTPYVTNVNFGADGRRHPVHHRRVRSEQGAVPWRRVSLEQMIAALTCTCS